MKKLFLFLLLSLSFVGLTYADFQDGLEASQKGDFKTAFKEWTPLAEQGDVKAQYNLGLLYLNGDGARQDFQQAFSWFKKAAEQGDARAQYHIGRAYLLGEGVTKDLKQGFEWSLKAAEQGIAKAQHNVGLSYERGQGVTKDLKQAFSWYKKAAEQGYVGSQVLLSFMYYFGEGVEINPKIAYDWMMKAANQGNACAHWHIGSMYIESHYLNQDVQKAYSWIKKAVDKGCDAAKTDLDKLAAYIAEKTPTSKTNSDELEATDTTFNDTNNNGSKKIPIPANATVSATGWKCNTDYYRNSSLTGCLQVPANAYSAFNDNFWSCKSGYKKINNSCIKIPENAYASSAPEGWQCKSTYVKSGNSCLKILLINSANLIGQEQYKTTSLENLSCKSSIVVTKGGGINVKQVESSTYQKSSTYSQGYTDVTNQRYFELKTKIRQARYELEDVNSNNASGGGSAWLALALGVATGFRKGQVQDKIRALENQLRNTKMTIRKQNKATYKVTVNTVSFEKTQRFKWMLINCINGEVSINEVTDKNNSGKKNFVKGINPNDILGLSSKNEQAKLNKLQSWSHKPLLSMSDINGNKSKVLTTSTINTDNISIASKVKWFLSTQ